MKQFRSTIISIIVFILALCLWLNYYGVHNVQVLVSKHNVSF